MTTPDELAEATIVRCDGVRWRRVADDVVVYSPATDEIAHLEPIAAALWQQIGHGATLEALIDWSQQHFAGDPAQMRGDIAAVVAELIERQLVTHAGSSEPARP